MSEYIKQHFYNEVIPDYLEYVEVRKLRKALDDRRKAMHAASVIEHFREILPAPFNDKNSIDKLCPGYHILVEAVNAFKHHDRRGRKNSMISQSM